MHSVKHTECTGAVQGLPHTLAPLSTVAIFVSSGVRSVVPLPLQVARRWDAVPFLASAFMLHRFFLFSEMFSLTLQGSWIAEISFSEILHVDLAKL